MIKFEHKDKDGGNSFFYLHAEDICEVDSGDGTDNNPLKILTYKSHTHYSCSDHEEIVKEIDLCLSK